MLFGLFQNSSVPKLIKSKMGEVCVNLIFPKFHFEFLEQSTQHNVPKFLDSILEQRLKYK